MWGQSFQELFHRGGPLMWPLLGCSIVAVALICDRLFVYWRMHVPHASLLARLQDATRHGQLDSLQNEFSASDRPLCRVLHTYLVNRGEEQDLREQAVARVASQQVARYDRRLNWLGIITHASPLLGLLGTVMGLVGAFHQIELKGGQVQPGDLASGIWSALLTTVCGLMIALPSLAAFHILQAAAGKAALQMQWTCSQLDEWLRVPGSLDVVPGQRAQLADTETEPVAGRVGG